MQRNAAVFKAEIFKCAYDVKMEYHKLAVKIVEFVKKECVHKKTVTEVLPETDNAESKPIFKPQEKSSDDTKITFADVVYFIDPKILKLSKNIKWHFGGCLTIQAPVKQLT